MVMPLEGVRVLDLTIWQQGPVASAMLADLGAEVIKIEDPVNGDPGRGLKMLFGLAPDAPVNPYFENNNRGKKAITLNLKTDAGREILHRLVKKSDVFVQNLRHGVVERLGIDYAALSETNPRLIYASGCGLGPRGPETELPIFDYVAQARGGLLTTTGEPDGPPGNIQMAGAADALGAMLLAYGVMIALFARERTGVGQEVHGSLLGAQVALGGLSLQAHLVTGIIPERVARTATRNPMWNFYQGADGRWLCIACLQTDRYWPDLCRVTGLPELTGDSRFNSLTARAENSPALTRLLDERFATRPVAEWLALLAEADIPAGLVQNYEELARDPMAVANGYVTEIPHPTAGTLRVPGVPINLSKTPGVVRSSAPEFGQHTEEILLDLCDYTWDDIVTFKEHGVI